MRPWTSWYVQEKDPVTGELRFVLNHGEEGHVLGEKPKPYRPEFTAQRAWANRVWKKRFLYRDENNVIRTAEGEKA